MFGVIFYVEAMIMIDKKWFVWMLLYKGYVVRSASGSQAFSTVIRQRSSRRKRKLHSSHQWHCILRLDPSTERAKRTRFGVLIRRCLSYAADGDLFFFYYGDYSIPFEDRFCFCRSADLSLVDVLLLQRAASRLQLVLYYSTGRYLYPATLILAKVVV